MRTLVDHLLTGLQFLLPHHLVTAAAHRVSHCRVAWFKNLMIRVFARIFSINWADSAIDDPNDFVDFNSFFTRALKPAVREISSDRGTLISPCDGTISACGPINGTEVFQAKGSYYSLRTLLADKAQAGLFNGGHFATIYLSPRDYHRIHMPLAGTLESMAHVPGRLFSVAPYTVRCINGLFTRNERSIHLFNGENGPFVMALIGAMVVGSMETVWHGVINPPRGRQLKVTHYLEDTNQVHLERGAEMGRFNMGSTVILVFPADTIEWLPGLTTGTSVQMGQPLAKITG
jgi:phosphatidylserine decarboxylase